MRFPNPSGKDHDVRVVLEKTTAVQNAVTQTVAETYTQLFRKYVRSRP